MKSLGSSLDLFNLPSHTEDYRFKRKIDIKDWNQPINDILAIEVQNRKPIHLYWLAYSYNMLNQVDNALSVLEKLVSMIESGQPQSDRSDLLQRRVYLEMVSCHARKKNLDKASNYAKKVVAEKQNILIDTLQTFGLLAQADSYLYAYYNLDVDLHNFEIAHCIADNATIHSNTPISRDIAEKQVLENIAALANAMDDPMRETSIRIFLYKKENNIENKLYHLRVVKKWVDRSPCSELFKQDIAFQLNY